jgi:hypothetical protein
MPSTPSRRPLHKRLARALRIVGDPAEPRSERARAARRAAAIGEKLGLIRRPETCESCGCGGPLERHHDRHDEPLAVRFVCHVCHQLIDMVREAG